MLIVWLLTGFWHGAEWNFLLWGLYYFIFLVLEKFILKNFLEKAPNFIKHIYTLIIIYFGWIIFRCDSLSLLKNYFNAIFSFKFNGLGEILVYLESYYIYFILAILFSTPIYYKVISWGSSLKNKKLKLFLKACYYIALIALFIITIMFLAYSSYNPFIYFRF